MREKTKILSMYLPQYHCIPENDEFWGTGFTDWVTVKKARPLFRGHEQPKVPLNENYYDLSQTENVRWQANLAREYGIDGFGIYHYWFNNEKNLLTKPAEIILENKDIDIDFFFAWDNANWKRSWSNVEGNDWAPAMENRKPKRGEPQILIPYILGEKKDWINHYNWLKPFFLDDRYIKKDNKPLFVIFNYDEHIAKMCICWNELAKQEGFDGMCFVFRYVERFHVPESEYKFKYEPLFSGWLQSPTLVKRLEGKIRKLLNMENGPKKYDYDVVWKNILENARCMSEEHMFHGAFVTYDDSPRRGKRGTITTKSSPEKFRHYLSELVKLSMDQGKEFIFLTAWNEWGEGAYLEPDNINGIEYLKAIKGVHNCR